MTIFQTFSPRFDCWYIWNMRQTHRCCSVTGQGRTAGAGDSRYCLCFVSACDHQLVGDVVMSPGPRDNHQGWIKSRVYFMRDKRWQPGEARGVDVSLLSSWHYDLWTQFMTVTASGIFSQSEALLTSIRPIRGECLYLSLHPREIEAVLCSCLPHLWAFSGDRAARHRGLWGICFWSFNIPDESHQKLLEEPLLTQRFIWQPNKYLRAF